MTAPWPEPTRFRRAAFDPEAAVACAFEVLRRNLAGFVLLAALVTLPNYLVAAVRGDHFLWSIVAAIVSGMLFYLAQGFIGYAAYQDMIGRPVGAGDSLRAAIDRFFPLLGLAGWLSLAVGIGFVLLIVPGVLFMVMWSVAVPACVVEGIAPAASMRRSAALTKGHRWSLFLLLLFLFIAVEIGLAALDRVLAMAGGGAAAAFGSWVGKALVAAFQAVLATAIYHELRAAEEGPAGLA
jgi:hypothetical protein